MGAWRGRRPVGRSIYTGVILALVARAQRVAAARRDILLKRNSKPPARGERLKAQQSHAGGPLASERNSTPPRETGQQHRTEWRFFSSGTCRPVDARFLHPLVPSDGGAADPSVRRSGRLVNVGLVGRGIRHPKSYRIHAPDAPKAWASEGAIKKVPHQERPPHRVIRDVSRLTPWQPMRMRPILRARGQRGIIREAGALPLFGRPAHGRRHLAPQPIRKKTPYDNKFSII